MDLDATVRYAWDPASDDARALIFDVMETVEGHEHRDLMQSKIVREGV